MVKIIKAYGIYYIGFEEKWKKVKYDDIERNRYYVSNLGRVRKNNRILKGCNPKNERGGYHRISLKNKNGKVKKYQIHRIVFDKFGKEKLTDEYEINHIDGNKNNNTIMNSELSTRKENAHHASEHDLYDNCEKHYKSIFTNEEVEKICEYASKGYPVKKIITILKLENRGSIMSNIDKILRGKTWKKISKKYNIDYNLYHYKTYSYDDINKMCEMIFIKNMKNSEIVTYFPQYDSKKLKIALKSIRAKRLYKKIVKSYM